MSKPLNPTSETHPRSTDETHRQRDTVADSTDRRPPAEDPLDQICDYTWTFLERVAVEVGFRDRIDEFHIADFDPNEKGPQFIAVCPDESSIVVGRDETSTDSGLFAFLVDADDPPVRTVEEGLELLRPASVSAARADPDRRVHRQGEWWFLETDREPVYTVSGQLDAKPYGPSPMENHVAREYGFGLPEPDLLRALSRVASDSRCKAVFDDIPGCFEAIRDGELVRGRNWSGRFRNFEWAEVPEACKGLFVRGSVRHRRNEHSMLSLGDSWHRTVCHNRTVYQPLPTTYGSGSIMITGATSVD